MQVPAITDYLKLAKDFGYTVFDNYSKPYNLNIVGFRNKYGKVNHFDDLLVVYRPVSKLSWIIDAWPITTYPGQNYLNNPINPKGTAILLPGQYDQCYELGTFKKHRALKQVGAVKVYRDNNKDLLLDKNPATIDTGLFGIHIHRAGFWDKLVGTSSAGCQVFQKTADFAQFIFLCEMASSYWGDRFTYTLVEI